MKTTRVKAFSKSSFLSSSAINELLSELGIPFAAERDLEISDTHIQSGIREVGFLHFHNAVFAELLCLVETDDAIRLSSFLLEWARYRNSAFVDYVVMELSSRNLRPTHYIWKIFSFVAKQRFAGNKYFGDSKRIQNEIAINDAFNLMTKMRWCGYTLALSASKTAYWMTMSYPAERYLASSLDKMYSKDRMTWGPNGELPQEQLIFSIFDRRLDQFEKSRQKLEYDGFPEAGDELKGNRRL